MRFWKEIWKGPLPILGSNPATTEEKLTQNSIPWQHQNKRSKTISSKSKSSLSILHLDPEKSGEARYPPWFNPRACWAQADSSSKTSNEVSPWASRSRPKRWTLPCSVLFTRTRVTMAWRVFMWSPSHIKLASCSGSGTSTRRLHRAKWSRKSESSMRVTAKSKGNMKSSCHSKLLHSIQERLGELDRRMS